MKKQKYCYFFLRKFPKYYIWIQSLYFGRRQKYIWKSFYSMKRSVRNRAIIYLQIVMVIAVISGFPCREIFHKYTHVTIWHVYLILLSFISKAQYSNTKYRKKGIEFELLALSSSQKGKYLFNYECTFEEKMDFVKMVFLDIVDFNSKVAWKICVVCFWDLKLFMILTSLSRYKSSTYNEVHLRFDF